MSTCVATLESSGQFLNLNMLCFWYDCIQKTSRYLKSLSPSKESMKNQWLRHYTCSGFCKTTYHLLISQPPKYVKVHTGDNKIDTARVECGASIHAIFQLTVQRIQMFFSLKPSQSQGKSSLKISARWVTPFWRSQGTDKQTNSLNDRLALLQSDLH